MSKADRIRELGRKGVQYDHIAERLNMSKSAVLRRLKESGIEPVYPSKLWVPESGYTGHGGRKTVDQQSEDAE